MPAFAFTVARRPTGHTLRRKGRIAAALGGAVLSVAAAAAPELPALPEPIEDIHAEGTFLQPACSDQALQQLAPAVREAAAGRQAEQAWRVARAVLCGRDSPSAALALQHMPARIVDTSYATGEEAETRQYVPRSAALLVQAQAWEAQASAIDGEIAVDYRCSAVCAAGFRLRFNAGRWLLVSVSRADD